MKLSILLQILLLFFILSCGQKKLTKPNIVLILADYLGFGEVGFNGQKKIKTPFLDEMAKEGMIFTNHYTAAPVCAPARCMILTGLHGGHAYIRGNDEWRERVEVWDYAKASEDFNLEGQRPMPATTLTFAKILQENGYSTGMVGKWGLGAPATESIPNKMGFDYFFGYNCQRQAHNLYPPHLWENSTKVKLSNPVVPPGTQLDSLSDPLDLQAYSKYVQKDYAPDRMHKKAIAFLEENRDTPFFLYYASPLPHLPLQAPQELVDNYITILGDEPPYDGSKGYFPNRYPRATYAAMISLLDQQVGEIKMKLQELGIAENTLILVTSDNGPTYTGGVDYTYFESSGLYANGYGKTKGFVYEGGIKVPMLAYWPGMIEKNSSSSHISIFYDIFPTICDLIGVDPPQGIDGKSFLPSLLGEPQDSHEFLYWDYPEYGGQQAVRIGQWKGIRQEIQKGKLEIALYDLQNYPQESENLAEKYPKVVAQIEAIMKREHTAPQVEKFKMESLGD